MYYTLTIKTPPAVEPVTVLEIQDYLKLDGEESYLLDLITGAREYCESFQNRAYITQTWELSMDYWPEGPIELKKGSLQAVNSIKYKDSKSIEVALAENTDYVYSTRGILGKVVPAYGKTWPSFTPYPIDAITVEFTCGYGDTGADVPKKAIQAIKLLVSHWYENRVPIDNKSVSKEMEFTITSLLSQDRIVPV